MKYYFFNKLIPPRPSFAQDMTDEEKRLMGEHAAYWMSLAEKGVAILFGPVADPKGVTRRAFYAAVFGRRAR